MTISSSLAVKIQDEPGISYHIRKKLFKNCVGRTQESIWIRQTFLVKIHFGESKWVGKKKLPCQQQRKARGAVLISDDVDFKTNYTARGKEWHFIMTDRSG